MKMNRHERECLANALLQVQNAQFRLGSCELHMSAGDYHAISNRLALAEVDLKSLARAATEDLRSTETDAPQAKDRP